MKLSPFTLIYQPEGESQERSKRRAKLAEPPPGEVLSTDQRLQELRTKVPDLAKALKALNPNLGRALIGSLYAQKLVEPKGQVPTRLWRVITNLQQNENITTVAVWDLGSKISGLSDVIEALNGVQTAFTFFELRAPVPAGLVIHSDVFNQWARKRMGAQIRKSEQQSLKSNFMFSDFSKYAAVVREQIGVDYLVGITPHMVAWEDGEDIYWNYFTASGKRIILVSAYNMREYATQAGRPFEAAMAGMVVAQLLQELNRKPLFHKEIRGCLFDFNEERDTIIETIRKASIEEPCLSRIDEKYREAAAKMVRALKSYSPKQAKVDEPTSKKTKRDDSYWLTQLAKLSSKLSKTNLD